jgi:hypothetical protein
MAKIIIKNSEISSSAGINIPGNLSIAGDTVIGDLFTDSLIINAHTTFNEDISAEEITISSSFKGNGSQLHSLTASNISNFTNDVRSRFSAGTNISISNGTISSTGGNVAGAVSSTDNAIVRFDGTTGKIIQDGSGITLSDTGGFSRAGSMSITTTGVASDISITAGDDLVINANDVAYVAGANTTIEGYTTSKLITSNQKVETTTGSIEIVSADTGADINVTAADNITNTVGYKSQYKIRDIIAGDLSTIDYTNIINTVRTLSPNGNTANPAYSFQNAAGSGMSWNSTDGVLAFSHNASNKFNIGGTAGTSLINGGPWIRWDVGGLNTPTYSFHGDNDTGIYSPVLNSVSVVHGGRERRSVSGDVTTTDAAATVIYAYTTTANTAYSIMCQCVCRQSTGAVNSYIGNVRAKNVSGTATAVMSLTSANEENITPTIGVTTSGANILFTVTGAASTTFKWFAWLEIISVS